MIIFFIASLILAFLGYYFMARRWNRYQEYPLWQYTLSILACMFGTYGVMTSALVFIFG